MATKNLQNALIAFLTPLPSILFYISFLHHFSSSSTKDSNSLSPIYNWCYNHPFLLSNVLFFFNVNVLFWLIGNLQSSHWMIDLYWTVIPILLTHFYKTHPLSQTNVFRSTLVVFLTWVWAIRLTHSYFRREKWQWGAREDWRFTDLGRQYGQKWWWVSFFAVYLIQQVFLMGVCFPLYVVHSVDKGLDVWDLVAAVVCLSGVCVAYFADMQLHCFVSRNEKLKQSGEKLVPNLDAGLWYYSRHPNYFGEQLWWWGLAMFAWNLGVGWACVGSLVNSLCLAYVTTLVEERMLKQEYRAEEYKRYQKTTSVWIPWFKKSLASEKKDT